MPFIAVPGVAQTVLRGNAGPNPVALIYHWHFRGVASSWSQSQLQTLVNQVFDNFTDRFMTRLGHSCGFAVCDGVDLTNSTPVTANSTSSGWEASATIPPPTLASSVMINFKTNARYRGGHPRTYLPGAPGGNTLDGDNWTAATVTDFQTAWQTFINNTVLGMDGVGLGVLEHVVPQYTYTVTDDPVHHKYIRTRNSLRAVSVVSAYAVSAPIRTQRRRLGK